MKTRIGSSPCLAILFEAVSVLAQPSISKQPANQTASLFADATFRVTATGTAPLSYQWQFNGAPIEGAVNSFLTLTNIQKTNSGSYSAIVIDSTGSASSQGAILTITPFNSMYFFGFSWTDTGGIRPDGSTCDWDPSQYYKRHASNGPMWPEFLSTNLDLNYSQGNNHAFCAASSVEVFNQVAQYIVPPSRSCLLTTSGLRMRRYC
jgi:S-formylglutathione hydrolase FrmB